MFGLGHWWRRRAQPGVKVPDELWERTLDACEFTRVLGAEERERLRERVSWFLGDKVFSGAAGLELDDAKMLAIAVQACMLILGLDTSFYRGWVGVIVYPTQFLPRHKWVDEAGVVHEDDRALMGEARHDGPVILSWDDVANAGPADGVNVVIHEFAHKLDMLNGSANGYPPLHADMSRKRWSAVFGAAFEDFSRCVARHVYTPIDPYAAESPAEFFAVLSETFFERPDVLQGEYPDVYDQMRRFYRQDPAVRLAARAELSA
jgi:hypothetical protein